MSTEAGLSLGKVEAPPGHEHCNRTDGRVRVPEDGGVWTKTECRVARRLAGPGRLPPLHRDLQASAVPCPAAARSLLTRSASLPGASLGTGSDLEERADQWPWASDSLPSLPVVGLQKTLNTPIPDVSPLPSPCSRPVFTTAGHTPPAGGARSLRVTALSSAPAPGLPAHQRLLPSTGGMRAVLVMRLHVAQGPRASPHGVPPRGATSRAPSPQQPGPCTPACWEVGPLDAELLPKAQDALSRTCGESAQLRRKLWLDRQTPSQAHTWAWSSLWKTSRPSVPLENRQRCPLSPNLWGQIPCLKTDVFKLRGRMTDPSFLETMCCFEKSPGSRVNMLEHLWEDASIRPRPSQWLQGRWPVAIWELYVSNTLLFMQLLALVLPDKRENSGICF